MSLIQTACFIYIAAINLAGFITALADKRRARRGAWRVPEKAFIWLSVFGGGLGVLVGFLMVRHKTKHAGLMLGVIMMTALFYGLAVYLFTRF